MNRQYTIAMIAACVTASLRILHGKRHHSQASPMVKNLLGRTHPPPRGGGCPQHRSCAMGSHLQSVRRPAYPSIARLTKASDDMLENLVATTVAIITRLFMSHVVHLTNLKQCTVTILTCCEMKPTKIESKERIFCANFNSFSGSAA